MEKGILAGTLVIEVAGVLAGPSAGMFLAEQGARVIKIENPVRGGDVTRGWKLASEASTTDTPAYFCSVNWGKESLTLNLKQPEDQAFLHRLLAQADFLLSSFLPGQASKLGLDPAKLQTHYPHLILAEINGYGRDNARPAFDAIIQGEAGFTHLNGTPGNTHKMPVALMDVLAAHQLCQALLLAYIKRLNSGEGSRVSVSLLQAGLSGLVNQASNWLVARQVPRAMGSAHPNIVPYGTAYPTAEGPPLILAVGNDRQFASLCKVLQLPLQDKWTQNAGRVLDRDNLDQAIRHAISQHPSDALQAALRAADVPVGQVLRMDQAMGQDLALDILLQEKGIRRFVGQGLPRVALSSPPALGAHTTAIRAEFGR